MFNNIEEKKEDFNKVLKSSFKKSNGNSATEKYKKGK